MTKVALVSGFWAQNIGNAFFNLGGKWALEQVFGKGNVQFIQDKPSYRTFYDQSKGDPKNYLGIHEILDIDYLVIQGPALTSNLVHIWGETFQHLKRNKVKIIFQGIAFFKYSQKEINNVKSFWDRCPPDLVTTRDSSTYNIIKNWNIPCHNGLDSAFFVPQFFNPLRFREKFYTFNFDRFPEPSINSDNGLRNHDYEFSFDDYHWTLKIPKLQQYFSLKGKAQAYLGHLLDSRRLPEAVNSRKIIRPEHRYVPHMTQKIYQHPNSFVSDELFTYISIYANTLLTLADRVHACVMTLAFGNPAMLFTISPRQALFERVGADTIRTKPTKINLNYLQEQIDSQINFMKQNV